jgi:hypothetical protein
MFRQAIIPIKKICPTIKRTCNNWNNMEDILRANSVIQYTKDEIINEVRTTLNNEFETKLKKEIEELRSATETMMIIQFGVIILTIVVIH